MDAKIPWAYLNRGMAFSNKAEFDRAIADFTKAIDINPSYVNAYYNRGLAYRAKGDHDRAIADYNNRAIADYRGFLSLNPNHAGARDALKRLGATP